ncbi:MAG: cytochrome d ubiquinol oxidase subunit II, partial [Paenibacillus sp. RIFOXYA1_FULL_44_5]
MILNTVWFMLIAVLFIGFFFLEGFDFGVGILLPFLGREDSDRRVIINTIGPFWDGNEVWFITAGGAMFAAFPNWYATLFSGFYLALFLLLVALIGRGVAFEFRSKLEHTGWKTTWDWIIFFGSLLPPLLWGVALANLMRGVPIDAHMNYVGTFWDLLNIYAVVCGVSVVMMFILHGALFLALKTEGE